MLLIVTLIRQSYTGIYCGKISDKVREKNPGMIQPGLFKKSFL